MSVKYRYLLKGKLKSSSKYLVIPNSATFYSKEEALRFYEDRARHTWIMWDLYDKVAIFKRPVVEDEFIETL